MSASRRVGFLVIDEGEGLAGGPGGTDEMNLLRYPGRRPHRFLLPVIQA
jgi:hypothetical protein